VCGIWYVNQYVKYVLSFERTLFDDDPKKINQIEQEFRKVTPALIQKTAQTYLSPENRTILVIEPKAEPPAAPKSGS